MRVLMIFGAMWATLSPHATAQQQPKPEDTPPPRKGIDASRFSADLTDDAIFNVDLDGESIAEGMDGKIWAKGVRLPLGQLAAALDLPIYVNPAQGRASGWFITKNRTFDLDVGARTVSTGGTDHNFAADSVVLTPDDIFVDSELLSVWLPLDIDISVGDLQVSVRPREKLPSQLRAERDATREKLFARFGPENSLTPDDTIAPMPYQALSLPFMGVSTTAGYSTEGAEEYGYDLRATGEVAWMTARFAMSGDREDALQSARFSLGREDPLGKLPLGMRRFEVGDTYTPSAPLISRGTGGAGIYVSNAPLTQPDTFDTTTLRGDLPAGYDVELYRNGALFNSQVSQPDGRYEFTDIPLEYGDNELRLVFYSPTGETRQEVRNVRVGQNTLKKGEFQYRVGATLQNQNLLTDNTFGQSAPGDGNLRAVAQAEIGVGNNLSLSGTLANIPVSDDKSLMIGGAGANFDLGKFSLRADVAANSENGWAVEGGAIGKVFGATVSVDHAELSETFLSDENLATEPGLKSRSSARLSFTAPLAGKALQTDFAVQRLARANQPVEIETTLRTTMPLGNSTLVSNSLRFRDFGNGSTFEGQVDVNAQLMDWLFRSSLNYETGQQAGVRSLSLQADKRFSESSSLRLGISHDFRGGSRASAEYTRRLTNADVSLGASYDTSAADFRVVASLRFGIGRDPGAKRWIVTPQSLADTGLVRANLYVDRDGDGRRGKDEEALPGVRVSLGGQGSVSDDDGQVILTGDPGRQTMVAIDLASLPDPYMLPAHDRIGVVPRPGTVGAIDLPVIQTGAVEGTTLFSSETDERPVGNVALELTDPQGRKVAGVRSQFDGVFAFDLVRPGKYTVQLEQERAEELGIKLRNNPQIEVKPDGSIVRGVRLVLETVPELADEEAEMETEPAVAAQSMPEKTPVVAPGSSVQRLFGRQPSGNPAFATACRILINGMHPGISGTREIASLLRSGRLERPPTQRS